MSKLWEFTISDAVQLEFSNDIEIATEVEVKNDPESESECESSSESDVSSESDSKKFGTRLTQPLIMNVNSYNHSTV